jgi:hypothetical protein
MWRAGLPKLGDERHFRSLQAALTSARDDACVRWRILETPRRLETLRRIVGFQRRLVSSGTFTDPRSSYL